MTIQEAQEFFAGSDFSADTKQKIADVLATATMLDPVTIAKIKELMQEELDKDFAEAGVAVSNNPEVQKAEASYKDKLDAIERDFSEDTAFVQAELEALDVIRKKVMAVADAQAAQALKSSM